MYGVLGEDEVSLRSYLRRLEDSVPQTLQRNLDCVIAVTPNQLFVVTQRGLAVVSATAIGSVHAAVYPLIEDGVTIEQLSARDSAPEPVAIERYISSMKRAGALVTDVPVRSSFAANTRRFSAGFPESDECADGTIRVMLSNLSVILAEAGKVSPLSIQSCDLLLLCVSRTDLMTSVSVIEKLARTAPGILTVLIDGVGNPRHSSRSRLADPYIRWLAQISAARLSAGGRISKLVRYDERQKTVRKVADLDRPEECLRVPELLGLVEPARVPQLPLAVARARWDSGEPDIHVYGLRYSQNLVTTALAELFLAHSICQVEERGLSSAQIGRVGVDRSSVELSLLESFFDETDDSILACEGCDLLAERSTDDDLEYLVTVLKTKRARIPGALIRKESGLYIYQTDTARSASLFRQKALRDILMACVWDVFYAGTRAICGAKSDFTRYAPTSNLSTLSAKFKGRLHQRGITPRVCVESHAAWGRVFCVGKII